MNHAVVDRIVLMLIGAMLAYAAAIFMQAALAGQDMGAWVWERHQNQFSWYSRPLFILPAAYYAYRHKLWHVIGFMALMGTSLFWFAPPDQVPAAISGYLDWEKQMFFVNKNKAPLVAFIGAVVVFLALFFFAFWQRNLWYGLLLINLGTLLKIAVSLGSGGTAGQAAVVPSLSSLLVINLAALVIWRWRAQISSRPDTIQ